MTIFDVKNKPHWPATDADFAKGGIYDQNTEAGKHAYEMAYFDNEPKLHPGNPGAYVPTLLGYTWLGFDKFSQEELLWVLNEYDRIKHNEQQSGNDAGVKAAQSFIDEAKKFYKGEWTDPVYTPFEAPKPPNDPTRGR